MNIKKIKLIGFPAKKPINKLIISVAAFFLVLEAVLRCVWGFGTPPLMESDPKVGYLFKKNQSLRRFGNLVKINNFHQRSEDINPEPEGGVLRILCLGDSVTWGGVLTDQSQTYPELLSNELKKSFGASKIEVINASAGSWGIGNELAYLEKFGTFKSSIVVHQINSEDFLQPASTGEKVGIDPAMPDANPPFAIWEVIVRYGPKWRKIDSHDVKNNPAAEISSENIFIKNMESLLEISKICRKSNARLILLHTPLREEISPSSTQKKIELGILFDRFNQFCKDQNIEMISLKSEWQNSAGSDLNFRDSIHPNSIGNTKIALEVSKLIVP